MWLQLSVPDNSLDSNPKFFHLGLEGVVSFGHFPVSQGPRPPKTPRRPGGVLPSLALGDSSAETLCVGFSVNQAPFPFYRTLVAPWWKKPAMGSAEKLGVPNVAPKTRS